MEDMYIKPGNQERGWNDPPQFSYGLQQARGQRTVLNKRAAPPASGAGALSPPPPPSSSHPSDPPPCGVAAPPLHPVGPPPGSMATSHPPPGPMRGQREGISKQAEETGSEPDVEEVVQVFERALASCRQGSVTDQVCNDVAKRLRLLEDSWRSGRLSLPVRRRMNALTQELQLGHWDQADDIHRSLMVDHVTEVSQWMVGVKRLIAETRKLSPELLEPLQKPAEPVQDPTEPPVQDPTEPIQDPVSSTLL